jgi:hypothetical protein
MNSSDIKNVALIVGVAYVAYKVLPTISSVKNTSDNVFKGVNQISDGFETTSNFIFNPLPTTENSIMSGMSLFNLAVPISQIPIAWNNVKGWFD